MPLRARLLVLKRIRSSKTPGSPGSSEAGSTRHDTMTGTPGSIVERRNLALVPAFACNAPRNVNRAVHNYYYAAARGVALYNSIPAYRKVGVEASVRRSRSILGYIPKMNRSKLVPTLVDLPYDDMFIPEKGKIVVGPVNGLNRINRKIDIPPRTGTMPSGRRFPLDVGKRNVSGDKVARYCNVNNTFTFTHEPKSSWNSAFNANCRAFGPISRDRHFRFYLKYITFFGMSEKDFRCAIRVRDLWIRGTRAYRKAIIGLNCSLPLEQRMFLRELPRKPRPSGQRPPGGR